MGQQARYRAGVGQLGNRRVLREAWGMFRVHYLRVAVVALLAFAPPMVLATLLASVREGLGSTAGTMAELGWVVGLLALIFVRLLGPVVFAGYLDEAVGQEYFAGRRYSMREVLDSLPWGRLVVADLVVVGGTVVGLSVMVVPGLVWLTLFALVGPVIVQERRDLVDAFRRTYAISRPAWSRVLILVVSAIAIEQGIDELVHDAVHDLGLGTQVAVTWLVYATAGAMVGLIEVALATELMARSPRITNG
jgi:hypothetical protein